MTTPRIVPSRRPGVRDHVVIFLLLVFLAICVKWFSGTAPTVDITPLWQQSSATIERKLGTPTRIEPLMQREERRYYNATGVKEFSVTYVDGKAHDFAIFFINASTGPAQLARRTGIHELDAMSDADIEKHCVFQDTGPPLNYLASFSLMDVKSSWASTGFNLNATKSHSGWDSIVVSSN